MSVFSLLDLAAKRIVLSLIDVEAVKKRMLDEQERSPFDSVDYWWRVADLMSSRSSGLVGHISVMMVVIGYFAVGDQSAPDFIHVLGVLELLFYVFIVGLALYGLLPVAMDKDLTDAEYLNELALQHAFKMSVLKICIRLSVIGTIAFFILVALRAVTLI